MKTVTSKKSQASRAPANGVPANFTYLKSSAVTAQKADIRSILNAPFVQRKVVIGQANDAYEHEADSVADRVMNNQPAGPISRVGSLGPIPTAQRQSEESGEEEKEEEEQPVQTKLIQRQSEESGAKENEEEEEPVQTKLIQRQSEESGAEENEEEEEPVQTKLIQRQSEESGDEEKEEEEEPVQTKLIQRQSEESGAEEKEKEEEPVQTKASPGRGPARSASMASAASRAIHHKGSGSPLQANVRQHLESSMGVDLADVRVHRDSTASLSNRALHARAFTHRNDIWLGENQSPDDLRLMAHEVTHVRQQDNVVRRKLDPEQDKEEEENKSSAGKAAPAAEIKPESVEPVGVESAPESKEVAAADKETGEGEKETETPSDVNGKKNFDEVIGKLGKLSSQQQGVAASNTQSKKTADQAAANASRATKMPAGEKEAHGQGKQVTVMGEAGKKSGGITREDKAEFLRLIRKRIDEINMPKTAFQHMIFVATGGPAKFKQGAVENINKKNKEIKSQLQTATADKPKPTTIPEPMPAPGKPQRQPGAPQALDIESARVLPPPKAAHEVSMEKEQTSFHAQNEASGITEEKLEKANDPRFSAAKDAMGEYDQNTSALPGKYTEVEQAELDKEKSEVESGEKSNAGKMRATRFGANKKIHGDQGGQMDKEHKKRNDVKTRLETIYTNTRKKVQPKLDGLEGRVADYFDVEEKIITLKFNTYVRTELDKFKDKRYEGAGGKLSWLWDKTLGDVNELDAVKQIYDDGVKLYVKLLDGLIDKIATMVVDTLNSCHKDIDDGIAEVNKEIKALQKAKDTAGLETARDVLEQFKDLRNKVTDKKKELANSLANKYQSSREKMNQALEKFKEENRSLREKAERFIDKVKEAYEQFKKRLSKILARARAAIQDILDDPIQFLKNILQAIKLGFDQFKKNIWTHLKRALYEWMFGSFGRAGVNIEIPKDFNPKSILVFIMSVLGFTKEWILERVAKVIGRQNVERLAKVYEFVKQLLANGLGGMYDFLKEKVGNLKEQIIEEVKSWVITQIIKAAIIKLVSMFNPVGAIVQAVLTIVDVVMFFANNIDLILTVLETIVDSVYKVVKGKIQDAANMIEKALAIGLALAIRFLARFARISGIVGKISSIIKRFKSRITRAVDNALKKIASKVRGLFGRGKAAVKTVAKKIKELIFPKRSFKAGTESHTFEAKKTGKGYALIVHSNDMTIPQVIAKAKNYLNANTDAGLSKEVTKLSNAYAAWPGMKVDTPANRQKKSDKYREIYMLTVKVLNKVLDNKDLAPVSSINWSADGSNRPTGVVANPLTAKGVKGSIPLGKIPGWDTHYDVSEYRLHLLHHRLHGPGRAFNLVPGSKRINEKMKTVEKSALSALGIIPNSPAKQKRVKLSYKAMVKYSTKPPNANLTTKVAKSVEMEASGVDLLTNNKLGPWKLPKTDNY